MKLYKLIISISLIFIIVLTFLIVKDFRNSERLYLGLLHYKIARDIKAQKGDVISNLNSWILKNTFTQATTRPEYLPIDDIPSHKRLINGYSACDGMADTYIKIGSFLNIQGYSIPLYTNDFSSSPHTTAFFLNEVSAKLPENLLTSKSLRIIDSLENIEFIDGEHKNASFLDICKKNLDLKNQEYSEKQKIGLQDYCNLKEPWGKSKPINLQENKFKKYYYSFLDLLSDEKILTIHKLIVDLMFDDKHDIFIKARNFDIFGNTQEAKRHYQRVIDSKEIDKLSSPYNGQIRVNLQKISLYFLTRLENRSKNEVAPNPFVNMRDTHEGEMYYEMYNYYSRKIENHKNLLTINDKQY